MHDFLLSCGHHLIDRDADVAAGVDVLVDENAHTYWERSDQFEMALDLTAGRNGLAKLGEVITLWIGHMLGIDVEIEPLNAMHDVSFNWYLGLDAAGIRIGDALWHGHDFDEQSQSSVVGLYQLNFKDPDVVDLGMRGQPVYLILAMTPDKVLHVKPQNLLTGLPIRQMEATN